MAGKREVNGEGEGPHEEDAWATAKDVETDADDSDEDPTFDALEKTRARLSSMSLSKSMPRSSKNSKSTSEGITLELEEGETPQLNEKEEKCFDKVEKMIKDGKMDKLKIDECKIYLRKYGLRLTGNKGTLQARIKEHLEVMGGGGEKKYPVSSFVLNCKGDACMGDVVMFEQNVYDMFSVVSRSATAPPSGTRTVAGRIVKESYGAAKQQHTFTVEVLWSKGEKPLPPLHPLLIKGRNLYRLKTMRQRWTDEEERWKVLQEKHRRGGIARCSRETRILEQATKKMAGGKSIKESRSTLARNTRYQALTSGKPTAAGAQNTRHQTARVSEKPIADRPENGNHRPEPDKCGDIAQRRQNGCSAQFMQPQASVTVLPSSSAHHENTSSEKPLRSLQSPSRWDLPIMEKRNYADQNVPMKCGRPIAYEENRNNIHRKPEGDICNALYQNIRPNNVLMRPEKPMGTGQTESIYHPEPEAHHNRAQFKLQNFNSPYKLGSPQHRHQFHASHQYSSPDRRPLRHLNSSYVPGWPPHGIHALLSHQAGFGGAMPPSCLNGRHPVRRQPCHFYVQGRCWYGDNCKFLHEIEGEDKWDAVEFRI